jgi:DNA replication licensing factor MCM7
LHNYIIQKYVEKRKVESELKKDGYQYVTPRTLLAIIRLSQGLARLRFKNEVDIFDIEEALRLIEVSRSQINEEDANEKVSYNLRNDVVGNVFHIIREMCNASKDKTIKISDLQTKVISKKMTVENMQECIEEYSNLNVIYVDKNYTEITLI